MKGSEQLAVSLTCGVMMAYYASLSLVFGLAALRDAQSMFNAKRWGLA